MRDRVSLLQMAKIAEVMPTTLRANIRILLKMVLQNGYSLKKDIAIKLEKANMRWHT